MEANDNSTIPLYTPYYKDDWHKNPVIYVDCEPGQYQVYKTRNSKCIIGTLPNFKANIPGIVDYIGICLEPLGNESSLTKTIKIPCPTFVSEVFDSDEETPSEFVVVVRVLGVNPADRDKHAIFEIPTGTPQLP